MDEAINLPAYFVSLNDVTLLVANLLAHYSGQLICSAFVSRSDDCFRWPCLNICLTAIRCEIDGITNL